MRSIKMMLFLVTLSYPQLPQTTQISTFYINFHNLLWPIVGGDGDFKIDRQVERSKYQPRSVVRSSFFLHAGRCCHLH